MNPPAAPRRARWAALVIVFSLLAVAACGGDDDTTDTATDDTEATEDDGTTTTAEPEDEGEEGDDQGLADLPTEEELAPALLTAEDLGEGWTEQPADEDDDDPLCGIKLTQLLGLPEKSLPNAEVTIAQDPNAGPMVFEALGFVPEGRGEEAVAAVREKLATCNDTEQGGLNATVVELAFEPLGDEAAAYEIGLTSPDDPADTAAFHIAYIRDGDLLVTVGAFDLSGNGEALLNEWATPAYEKAAAELL